MSPIILPDVYTSTDKLREILDHLLATQYAEIEPYTADMLRVIKNHYQGDSDGGNKR